MAAAASEIRWLQVERPQLSEIRAAQAGEFIQQLCEGLAFRFAELREPVEGIERPGFSGLEDSLHPRNPVGAFAMIQVTDDVECRPGIFAFVAERPGIGQIAEQCVERRGRAGERSGGGGVKKKGHPPRGGGRVLFCGRKTRGRPRKTGNRKVSTPSSGPEKGRPP